MHQHGKTSGTDGSGATVSQSSSGFMETPWRIFEYGVASEQGSRKTMEDQHAMVAESFPFFAVYDGHGGTQCAEFLRDNLHTFIFGQPEIETDPERATRAGIAEAENAFLTKCADEKIESGSTCAVALVVDDTLIAGNVGDSEIVLCRAGAPIVLSTKHSIQDNVSEGERVKACGGRIISNRVGHPKFNPQLLSLAITRAIGDAGFKLREFTDGKPSGVIADAETRSTRLTDDDKFLIIGCDGLWDVMSYEAAVQLCSRLASEGETPKAIAGSLCQEALRQGSTDNVTCIYINIRAKSSAPGCGQLGSGDPLHNM
ncbi:protein phosphatase 2C, putative [Trypanosoma equiperdum]|uniref:Protein phosphatase 2C, putative n=4 Tax=Trypanozoon TaxID=39700 RepID=Q583I2_TRYB2|nr:protein phosphatase 2C, putative [Trypanosoma brucei gambiense DAL972]XP_844361.1 protein phosphatase 2C, putative [Trypanosoma brucei brucei TREU927]AAX79767.1 protein phosphatase 2C, putative [Trypanosoma brucei]RHW73126.1 protein phosphatase 2C [Trypanosoma brucei equiperdum]SCU69102.1 protein phosphatase 2C, putative [Trypanosoma equiperdum]AAZ10802.1 protein phosphatase 2C, putative [Trypanosoma brucei brucei TREU927]CBH10499.1 protein phosphatase 2C, putative [Trypanosoma brucei gamb|eukprot:XP_011772789.1 protein phosphatase 2C, putative [Trypanosoma brucei gambiense DAL972]